MQAERDAFGQYVMEHYRTGSGEALVIERDDGLVEQGMRASMYLASPEELPPRAHEALALARGRVLDVGMGAGRHALQLQAQGYETVGIDVSPLACEVARLRGVRDVRLMSITHLEDSLGRFDTILLMDNNFGLMGDLEMARIVLQRMLALTSKSARIIVEGANPYAKDTPAEREYQESNRRKGRLGGQLRLRLRYRHHRSEWFDYLLVSVPEMKEILQGTGWIVTRVLGDEQKAYTALIEKTS